MAHLKKIIAQPVKTERDCCLSIQPQSVIILSLGARVTPATQNLNPRLTIEKCRDYRRQTSQSS